MTRCIPLANCPVSQPYSPAGSFGDIPGNPRLGSEGTAAELTPVREIDDRMIGRGSMGPVTELLQARFFDVVKGTTTDHADWRTVV